MLSKKQLKVAVKNLTYFDRQLNILQQKVDKINPNRMQSVLKFKKEFKIVSKFLCIATYIHLPEDYSNPTTRITKYEYKKICLNPINATSEGIIPRVGGMFFEPDEWNIYLETYKELQNERV